MKLHPECVLKLKRKDIPDSDIQVAETFWLSLVLMIHSNNNHLGWVNTEETWLHLFYIKMLFRVGI